MALAAHGPPHFSHAAPVRKKEGRAWLRTALPGSPMLRQLAEEEGRAWLRTALPGSPMLRQLAEEEGRAWLRTALPGSPMLRPARKRGRSGLGCARPSPVSPMLRQLAWEPPKKSQFL